jgi:hypothetical protein
MINVVELVLGPPFIGVFTVIIFRAVPYIPQDLSFAYGRWRRFYCNTSTHISSWHWKPVRNDIGAGHLLLLVVSGR